MSLKEYTATVAQEMVEALNLTRRKKKPRKGAKKKD
jgi:hypothetical protein